MRFLVDAQLSPRLSDFLRTKGHEAEHVSVVLGATARDEQILAHARGIGAVIVSKDGDFTSLLDAQGDPTLLWVRTGNTSHRLLIERLEAHWQRIERELLDGVRIVELG